MSESPAHVAWTARQLLIATCVIAFCLMQIAVPIAMLVVRGGSVVDGHTPGTGELPFSWQMYTVVLTPPSVVVHWPDGRQAEHPLESLIGPMDARLAYDDGRLARLCALFPGAAGITYLSAGAEKDQQC